MEMINGLRVQVLPEFVEHRITLRERFFAWPWRWFRPRVTYVPNPLLSDPNDVYVTNGTIYMSDRQYKILKKLKVVDQSWTGAVYPEALFKGNPIFDWSPS